MENNESLKRLNDLSEKITSLLKNISLLSNLADKYPTLDIEFDFSIIDKINKIDQLFGAKNINSFTPENNIAV